MSPKRSEQLIKVAAVEALVCRDVGRKTLALIHATRGDLLRAATAVANARHVGLITGFFVLRGDVAAPETDGPVGAALLAAALAACGVPARIAVDTPCAGAVKAAIVASGDGVSVDEVGVDDRPGLMAVVQTWKNVGVTHAIAIERCGRSTDGRPRNMRGVDVSPWTAPLDDLFLAGDWIRVAIGDGGNEIGMGKLPAGMIADNVPMGDKIASVTGCDHLIVAGVSNWGAFGLMASLAIVRPDWSPAIARFLTVARGLEVTQAIVEKAGAVDGVTARSEATVDGFGPEVQSALIDNLRRIAWPSGAH